MIRLLCVSSYLVVFLCFDTEGSSESGYLFNRHFKREQPSAFSQLPIDSYQPYHEQYTLTNNQIINSGDAVPQQNQVFSEFPDNSQLPLQEFQQQYPQQEFQQEFPQRQSPQIPADQVSITNPVPRRKQGFTSTIVSRIRELLGIRTPNPREMKPIVCKGLK
jgi:hypothetical protein